MAIGEVITPEMPAAFAPYAALLFSRFPEVLLALGHPSLSKDFELPPSANSCTVIEETGEYKLVQVVLGRQGLGALLAQSAVRPRRSTALKSSTHRSDTDRTKKSPTSDGVSRGAGRRSRKSAGSKTELAATNMEDSMPAGFWSQQSASGHHSASRQSGERERIALQRQPPGGREGGEANQSRPRLGRIFRTATDELEISEAASVQAAAPAPVIDGSKVVDVAPVHAAPVVDAVFSSGLSDGDEVSRQSSDMTHASRKAQAGQRTQASQMTLGTDRPRAGSHSSLNDAMLHQEQMRREEAAQILKANRRHSTGGISPSHSFHPDQRPSAGSISRCIHEPESPRSPGSFKPWDDKNSKAIKPPRGTLAQEASQIDDTSLKSRTFSADASPSFSLTNTEQTDEHTDRFSSLELMSPFNSNKDDNTFC